MSETPRSPGRRAFLSHGVRGGAAFGLFALGGSVLLSCGDDDSTATSSNDGASTTAAGGSGTTALPKLGTFTHQVNWLPGAGWAGSYMAAEAGIYEKLGFEGGLEMLYGGPSVAVEPVIQSGKALMGLCNSETFAGAVRQGADLIAVGAYMQRNPFCIASLPDNPIKTPQDMVGKKIGIQALNETLWSALLKINDIDESSVEKVVLQNDPTPLVNGEVAGFLSFVTNQPVTLELFMGVKPEVMMLDEYGFTLYQQLYVVTTESYEKKLDAVTAGLKAEIIGKQMLNADPDEGIRLTIEKYAADQDINADWSKKSHELTVPLAVTPTTEAKGLMYMTDEDIAKNVETLALLDLEIPASSYTHDVLDTIYADGIDLI
jgi:ABC-type nitrate/sulfonate/bicarbonate transport system substrate-binding protein